MKCLRTTSVLAVFVSMGLLGCGGSTQPPAGSADQHAHEHGEHDHPAVGPHHGSLIELGSEQYHAELVHDDVAGTVTVYILDSNAKAAVPVASPDLSINIMHEEEGEQFKVVASPDASDPAGKASRFVSDNKELAEELDHDHAGAQIVVTIDGKQFRGSIDHHHEEEHEHSDEHSH